jgi:hypothetical protein
MGPWIKKTIKEVLGDEEVLKPFHKHLKRVRMYDHWTKEILKEVDDEWINCYKINEVREGQMAILTLGDVLKFPYICNACG